MTRKNIQGYYTLKCLIRLCDDMILESKSLCKYDLKFTVYSIPFTAVSIVHVFLLVCCYCYKLRLPLRGETVNYRSGAVAKELLKTVF